MSVTCDKLLNPINPGNAETLKRLYSVVGSMPVVLLGAFARDLIFYHVHGIEVPRATMDMDTCVQMASWDDFNAACEQLKELGFTNKKEEHPEKFFDANGQEVDLLPFGSLSEDGKTITWPQDDSLWTITGIQEAHDHAWLVRVDEIELRVIPPCAMIYLKMFAIYDRPDDRKRKDTGDIQFVLKNYLEVTGRERLRAGGSDGDVMELVKGDLESATARVAGRDMRRILSAASAEQLAEIFRKETVSETWKPIAQQLANLHQGQFGRAREILISLRDGFNEVRSSAGKCG
jgi:predicted nucleotidyltransferase